MILGIIFYTLYVGLSIATGYVAHAISLAELTTNPKTRDLNMGWLSWPIAVLTGVCWPISIPFFVTWAAMVK